MLGNLVFVSRYNYLRDIIDVCTVLDVYDFRGIDAIFCDMDYAKEMGSSVLHTLRLTAYSNIPAFLVCRGDVDMDVYSEGYDDVITAPFNAQIIKNRLKNTLRARESLTFPEIERILKELPSNIYLKDSYGRYVFASHYWDHLIGKDTPGWTIRGKTDIEIRKDKRNALKAMETDECILKTGEGVQYVIEEKSDDKVEYLEIIKCPTHALDGSVDGIVAIINNVTEKQMLKNELERLSKVDSLTGLYNKKAFEDSVKMCVEDIKSSSSFGALAMVDVDDFKSINDLYGHVTGDKVLKGIGSVMCDCFGDKDVKGRVGGDEFMVFIRSVSTIDDLRLLLSRFSSLVMHLFSEDDVVKKDITMSMGVSLYGVHGTTFGDLYKVADEVLYSVKSNGKAHFEIGR